MELVVFSPPASVRGEIETINSLFASGLQSYHLRKPKWSEAALTDYIDQIHPRFRKQVMLHSHHRLGQHYKLKGIHYTEKTRPPPPINPIPNNLISTSFHSLSQLEVQNYGAIDYAFLSPILDSISKPGYTSAFDRKDLAQHVAKFQTPLIALGGIDTTAHVAFARELGFRGVAVLGAIWGSENPVEKFQELMFACKIVNDG
ncbi:hypothetical protein BSKO_11406 [Bryopsis sp. KO-2023]|nr:hypothetical protein BSKO_11406 [Bryopsis sp. KO-2023]